MMTDSKYRSLGDSVVTFIFHLEPSKESKLYRRLTQAFEEVNEKYGSDPAHLYDPHCSLTSFFCVNISETPAGLLGNPGSYSDFEEFIETCCETESALSRWSDSCHSPASTAASVKPSSAAHEAMDGVRETYRIIREELVKNIIGVITTECEMKDIAPPKYRVTANGIQLETPAFEILAQPREPHKGDGSHKVLTKTPSGHALVPLVCDWFTAASGSDDGLSRINLLCRNIELSLRSVGRVFPLRKPVPQTTPQRTRFSDLSSVVSCVSDFFSRGLITVNMADVPPSEPAMGVRGKRVDHLSLASHRPADVLDAVSEIFAEALIDSVEGSLWDIVAYERVPLGESDHEFVLKEVIRVADIGMSALPGV